MKILTEEELHYLKILTEMEAENINIGFRSSEFLGKALLSNAFTSFINLYLKKRYGNVIPSMSSEYRYFTVSILKNINKKYEELALKELISPTFKKIEDKELLQTLSLIKTNSTL